MCDVVLFSLAARQKLEQRHAARPTQVDSRMDDIARKLRLIFPEGRAAIVQDLYSGYRIHDDEYVLLVELSNSGERDGRYVVKLGPPSELRKELDAWRGCRPAGLRHDLVLMPIEPRPNEETIEGLVYADAQQFIGVDQTLTLEAALLDACRVGFPTPESVADVLFHLYERLGVVMYRYASGVLPQEARNELTLADLDLNSGSNPSPQLPNNLEAWMALERVPFEVRAYANTPAADPPFCNDFRDPVDFFRWVDRHIRGGKSPAELLPSVLRGRGHGDLHGRNVLVGRVGDRVLWPAVYDHEHMGRRNLIGWDFVKLETEFKARAYPVLFPGLPKASVPDVITFERELFERTEDYRESGNWPNRLADTERTHRGRLGWLILKIREAACRQLGQLRGRSREWLAEYYFLLTLYGLNSIRYKNLESSQLLCAYLSSGTACARYAYDLGRRLVSAKAPEGNQ